MAGRFGNNHPQRQGRIGVGGKGRSHPLTHNLKATRTFFQSLISSGTPGVS
jgi:hypothetical protein